MIKKDNKISTDKISIALGISSKTVKRHIKEIKIIQYVVRGANGHWEITDQLQVGHKKRAMAACGSGADG